jgi:hypothetical protein
MTDFKITCVCVCVCMCVYVCMCVRVRVGAPTNTESCGNGMVPHNSLHANSKRRKKYWKSKDRPT